MLSSFMTRITPLSRTCRTLSNFRKLSVFNEVDVSPSSEIFFAQFNVYSADDNDVVIGAGHLNRAQDIRIGTLFTHFLDEPVVRVHENDDFGINFQTATFRASATLEMSPITDQQTWKVGWIQACTDMSFRNKYGDDGYTCWEFPELAAGMQEMISDCDGHHYPWYGSRNETVMFEGPCKMYQTATITMNDNFHPHVTWRNPAFRQQSTPNLTNISRNQSFYVWLVAWNMTSQRAYILKTVKWTMTLAIEVDPTKPLGQRAKLVSDPVPKDPIVLEQNVPIPKCALTPPNANSAQMLVWRPTSGKPMCIIPPVWKKDIPIDKQVLKFDSKLCKL